MKLAQIRDVVAVAEHGSLRSAARRLNQAQSSITRSIRELEHDLGVTLFERRSDGAVLTPAGEAFVRRARGIQLDLQRAREELEQMRGGINGSVTVGLSTAVHISLLPRVIQPFLRRYPNVQLVLAEGLFPSFAANLQDGTLDLYVGPLTNDSHQADLTVEQLFENKLIVLSRRGHALSFATSVAELVEADWIASSITFNAEVGLHPIFEQMGLPPPRIVAKTGTALSMITLVSSSDLLAFFPQQWLTVVAATDIVQKLTIREDLHAAPICAAHRTRLPLTPAAEHLLDLFRRASLNHAERSLGQAQPASRGHPEDGGA